MALLAAGPAMTTRHSRESGHFPSPPHSRLWDSAILRTSPHLSQAVACLDASPPPSTCSRPGPSSRQAPALGTWTCQSGAQSSACLPPPTHALLTTIALFSPAFYPKQELLSFIRLGTAASLARPEPSLPGATDSKDTSPREGFLHTPKKLQEIGPSEAWTNAGSVPTARWKWAWGWHSGLAWVAFPWA